VRTDKLMGASHSMQLPKDIPGNDLAAADLTRIGTTMQKAVDKARGQRVALDTTLAKIDAELAALANKRAVLGQSRDAAFSLETSYANQAAKLQQVVSNASRDQAERNQADARANRARAASRANRANRQY